MSLEVAQERHRTTGRNDACPCGSGKKYKKCHQGDDDAAITAQLKSTAEAAAAEAAAKAAAEEAEAKGKDKDASKGKSQKTPPKGQRGASTSAQGTASSKKGSQTKSLPRRAAV